MLFLISGLIFITVSLLVAAVLRPRTAAASARIDGYLLAADAPAPHPADFTTGFGERVLRPTLGVIGRALRPLTPAGALAKIRSKLDMAGNPRFVGATEYVGLKVLSVVVIIPLGVIGLRYFEIAGPLAWLALAIVIALGIWLPDIILQRTIEGRQTAIRRGLPDALDLLVVSVEAGIGFDGAMQKVVERKQGPLAEELGRVLEQVRLGRARAEALREMARRTQVSDFVSFVAAVQQAESMGVSIAKVLRAQADAARKRRSERARETAAKLPVKLLFPLVFFIFPALFVVILGPAAIRFSQLFKVLGK